MNDLQLMIAFSLAGVVIWNLMRIVHCLDEITRVMKRNSNTDESEAPAEARIGPNVPWSRKQVFWAIFLPLFVLGMLYMMYLTRTIEPIDRWQFVIGSSIIGFVIAYVAAYATSRSITEK